MRRTWMASSGLAALLAVTITVTTAHRGLAASRLAPARLAGTNVWPEGARPAPAFALRDQTGHLISTASLRGWVWAITFLDAHCTQACPVAARQLAATQHLLGSRYPLRIVVVSTLPQYDTPSRVRAFAHRTGMSGDWHWLLGSRAQLRPVWDAYGIFVVTGIQHTAALYLVDQRDDVRVADAIPFFPQQLASSVRALEPHAPGSAPRR